MADLKTLRMLRAMPTFQDMAKETFFLMQGTKMETIGERKVIRHGNRVTKTNTTTEGPLRVSNEAAAMRFLRENTTIPVPEPLGAQLRDYLTQLRSLRGPFIGSFDGGPAVDSRMLINKGGPFRTVPEYIDFVLSDPPPNWPGAAPMHSIVRSQMRPHYDVVFTHGNLKSTNILVEGSRIKAIIDWEYAGYYPEYLEYVSALRGTTWRCPYYAALLGIFPERYDAEYVAEFLVPRITRNGR
ncbi:hypothetical protein VM1G_08022 [Cytospora mali]|uniref:Aminoglycoside phosphotransferase domain-containing protein n=1 Tax=Cytospora mali TaxID=578113 RepID=A0A194W7J6_CYTMA|nr:hypothetical protein VM1G_08022 [Valsa mali]